jgi:hypothetical protein
MGIQRENGYSASVEAFLVVGDQHIRLAKTGPDKVVLVEPCELAPGNEGELAIIVDGHSDSQTVILDDGAMSDRHEVRYSVLAPF